MANPEQNRWMSQLHPSLGPLLNRSSAGASGVSMTLPEDDPPYPMPADCKIVHGKVKGPASHALCGKHGHVVDTKTRMVIARSLDEYYQSVHMDAEDMSTRSKDRDIARSAATVRDTAPIMAAQDKALADEKNKNKLTRYHDVAAAAHTAVLATTTKYSLAVVKACEALNKEAEPLLKELKETEADDLFGPMLEFVAKTLLGELGKKAVEGLEGAAKKVGEKIASVIEDELVKAAKSKFQKKSGVDALTASMKTMIDQANLVADHIGKVAEENIGADLKRIADTAGGGKDLSAEDEALIKPFLEQDYNIILEGFGIPSKDSAAALQVKIFGGLYKAFYAELWQQRRVDSGIGYGDSREANRIGQKHAEEKMHEREKDIAAGERPSR